jgi:hypothetical protein
MQRLITVCAFALFGSLSVKAQFNDRKDISSSIDERKSYGTTCSDNEIHFFRKWWQIALADAAGALGGVASGMQICKHWLCSAFGGVIGAAGASVSVARVNGAGLQAGITEIPVSFQNKYEIVGNIHNAILRDYYQEDDDPGPEKLYEFILRNKSKYGFDEVPLSPEIYRKIVNSSLFDFPSVDEALSYLNKIIPATIAFRLEFMSTVRSLLNLPTIIEFNLKAIEMEDEFFKGKRMAENDRMHFEVFFSTLRHSANLWY